MVRRLTIKDVKEIKEFCILLCFERPAKGEMKASLRLAPWTSNLDDVTVNHNIREEEKIIRTRFLFHKEPQPEGNIRPLIPDSFALMLREEIEVLKIFTSRHNLKLSIDLNGTVFLDWENMPFMARRNVMTYFPEVNFLYYEREKQNDKSLLLQV